MNVKRRTILKHVFSALIISTLILSSCGDNPVAPVKFGGGDDYDVYHAIFVEAHFDSSTVPLLLADSTSTTVTGEGIDTIRIARFKAHLPGILDETLSDLISANRVRERLYYIRQIPALVLRGDYVGASGDNAVWISVSRVGYDQLKSQAAVELGAIPGPEAGSGTLYFLIRENGEWKVKGKCLTWVS